MPAMSDPCAFAGRFFVCQQAKLYGKSQCVTTGDLDHYERRRLLAITKERKYQLVADYADLLSKTDGFIVTEYRGLSVSKLDDLRNRLRDAVGGGYTITKNTLFSIALEQSGWPVPEALLEGPTAVVFGNGNLPAVAKAV